MDDAKELQWLYPDEFQRLVSCALVPLEARRLYALATYLFVRAGELKALDWSEVDVERGIVSVRISWDRDSGELKQPKTGNKGLRRFAIEPTLMPLLRAMHTEANGVGPVTTMRQQKWWASDLRKLRQTQKPGGHGSTAGRLRAGRRVDPARQGACGGAEGRQPRSRRTLPGGQRAAADAPKLAQAPRDRLLPYDGHSDPYRPQLDQAGSS